MPKPSEASSLPAAHSPPLQPIVSPPPALFRLRLWSLYVLISIGMQPQAQPQLSRTRQALVQLRDELGQLLEVFLARDPLVKGSVYELRRKCGKPTCACARGALHGTVVLSWSEGGHTRLRSLPPGCRGDLRGAARRYRRFRQARARLVKLHAEMLALIDALEAGRRETPSHGPRLLRA